MSTAATKKNRNNWEKFQAKKVDAYSYKFGNSLSAWFYAPPTDEEGFQYRLNLLAEAENNDIAINIDLTVGEFELSIQLDQRAADVLLGGLVPEKFVTNVPRTLFQAVFFKRFSKVFKYVESEFDYEVNVVSFSTSGKRKNVRKGSFCWDILHAGTKKGELWVSSKRDSNQFLEKVFFNINGDFSPTFVDQTPVILSIVLPGMQLSKKEFSSLEAGDVLVLDKSVTKDKALLPGKLKISPDIQSSVTIDKKKIVVRDKLEKAMSTPAKNRKKKTSVEDVQLDISFEYAEKRISFASLKKIGPGYVITLDKDSAESVDILANGKSIGVGEIVQVGTRTGIRVLELYEGKSDGGR